MQKFIVASSIGAALAGSIELVSSDVRSGGIGIDNIKGYGGKRHALKVGPIVLACVGKIDHNEAIVLPLDATADPTTWLVPVPGAPLEYTAKGVAEVLFVPPWMIRDRNYTMYPVFAK